jgi:excisionase family DNA binding protein
VFEVSVIEECPSWFFMSTQRNTTDAVNGNERRLLRIEEVADQLSVSRSFAWKLVAQGDLRSVRIGRAVRVRPADLDAFLADAAREG